MPIASPPIASDVWFVVNPTPHDALVRAIFGQPPHAAAELEAVLPPKVLGELDLATLRPLDRAFVDATLRASAADLLFEVQQRSGVPAWVYLLLEHQSTVDRRLPLRLLAYMTRIWERQAEQGGEAATLPPIVPVLIHQGPRPFRGSARFVASLEASVPLRAAMGDRLLDFEFFVDDLAARSDAQLLARGRDAIARLAWLALRNGRDHPRLLTHLTAAIRHLEADLRGPATLPALVQLYRYVCDVSDEPWAAVKDAFAAALTPASRSSFMTIADQLRAEGRIEGRVEALRESLLELLQVKFGEVDAATRARITAAESESLRRWLRRLLEAATLPAVFEG